MGATMKRSPRSPRGATRFPEAFAAPMVLLHIVSMCRPALAQSSPQLCACTPSVYQFQLNFNLTCDDTSFALSPAITDIQCTTTPDVVLDTTTAEAYNIQFVELDQNRLVLSTLTVGEPQRNGAIVTFPSYISDNDDRERVPGSLQVGITARDATTSTVFQQWVLQFSNDCATATYPVVSVGQQIGWTSVANVTPPSASYCPAAGGNSTTRAPTSAPASNATNTTRAPATPAPVSPAPALGTPTSPPVIVITSSPTMGKPTTPVPYPTPTVSSPPQKTALPTVECPPYIWSKGGKGKGKGKGKGGGFGENLFDREFIPVECLHKSSKGSKSKGSKSKKGSSKSGWGKGMAWPTPPPEADSSSSKWGKGKGKGAAWPTPPPAPSGSSSSKGGGSSSKWGKGKGSGGWPSQPPGPSALPPAHYPYPTPPSATPPNSYPSPASSPSMPLAPSPPTPGTQKPSGQYPTPTTDDLFVLKPTFPPAPSIGPQAALGDDGAESPAGSVESEEPGEPTQAPGAGAAASPNQTAAISGIVVAGVAVTGLAALYLLHSTGVRPKPDPPIPPMIGGSRMSTGGETLSADSRPSSPHQSAMNATSQQSQPLSAARLRSGGSMGAAARRASTLATGFHEQPILEETVLPPLLGPDPLRIPPPPLRDAATGAAVVAGATMARAGLDHDAGPRGGAPPDEGSLSRTRSGRARYPYRSVPTAAPPSAAMAAPSSLRYAPDNEGGELASRRWARPRSSAGLDPEGDTLDVSESSYVVAD